MLKTGDFIENKLYGNMLRKTIDIVLNMEENIVSFSLIRLNKVSSEEEER